MPERVLPFESGNERLSPEMTPADKEPTNPRGWPTANASSPMRAPPPSTAGTTTSGSLAGVSTAMSWSGSVRSEEHTSELQSQSNLVCRLLLEKKKKQRQTRLHSFANYTTYGIPTFS